MHGAVVSPTPAENAIAAEAKAREATASAAQASNAANMTEWATMESDLLARQPLENWNSPSAKGCELSIP